MRPSGAATVATGAAGTRYLRPTVAKARASRPATTKPTIQRAAPVRRGGSANDSSGYSDERWRPGVGVARWTDWPGSEEAGGETLGLGGEMDSALGSSRKEAGGGGGSGGASS